MQAFEFVGPLIRIFRLEKDWSQETLCHGICAVSYLSKIEQGKVMPNESLLEDLLNRLGISWVNDPEDKLLVDNLYDGIFSLDWGKVKSKLETLDACLENKRVGTCWLDLLLIHAYATNNPGEVMLELTEMLNPKQRCLYEILRQNYSVAYCCYSCALSAYLVAEQAYLKGNYTYALEYLHIAYEKAATEGYVHIMMYCQNYMANCYADLGNMDAMKRHCKIAIRIGHSLGDKAFVDTISYNLAATELEQGNIQVAYDYFSKLEVHSVMSLHKLAIACEALGKTREAVCALDAAASLGEDDPLENEMCDLVRYRLTHADYLREQDYGECLVSLFQKIKTQRHFGYARFHLRWVMQWMKSNRRYREAYEILLDFTKAPL